MAATVTQDPLTQTEYEQLPDVAKIDYWRRRFYDLEEERNAIREERDRLRRILGNARVVLQQA